MQRILITGGSGFIGLHLAEFFSSQGYEVTIFDKNWTICSAPIKIVVGDLMNEQLLSKTFAENDVIIHAAGVLGTHETVSDPATAVHHNVIGSLNVLNAATKLQRPILCISKPNVWLNPYSISKDSMEKFCYMYAKEYGTRVSILKLFNVYGPRQKYRKIQKAIPTWIVQMLQGEPVEVFGSGNATMDLINVHDVCRGISGILENFDACAIAANESLAVGVHSSFPDLERQVLQMGSGTEISVCATIEEIARVINRPHAMKFVPMRRGEVDGTRLCADNNRLTQLTKFQPKIALKDGLRATVDYYVNNINDVLSEN